MADSGNDHAAMFKGRNVRGQDHLRRRRQDQALQLRKNKREENLAKRRNMDNFREKPSDEVEKENQSPQIVNQKGEGTTPQVTTTTVQQTGAAATGSQSVKLLPLTDIAQGIVTGIATIRAGHEPNYEQLSTCVQHCRKMLSRERKPPIDAIIDKNLVPHLVDLLTFDSIMTGITQSPPIDHVATIMFEAAWALTNICSGNATQTDCVVTSGAVPKFVRLLTLTDRLNVVEQAAWALGNIAGDGAKLRDQVLENNALEPLVRLIELPHATVNFLQNTTWTLSNLCRNKNPPTSLHYVHQILPTLVKLLSHSDRQVKTDACWAMSYLTDGTNDRIGVVLEHGSLPPLVNLLMTCNDISVLTPVLRSVGNIVTGTDEQTQSVIDSTALSAFPPLLGHERTSIQKEAAWTLSNITAGTKDQIQAIIDAKLVEPIMSCLNNGDFKTQKEAVWAVTNFTSGGTSEQVRQLCQAGAIVGLCNMLSCSEDRTLTVILDGLQNILIHAEKLEVLDSAIDVIEECGGLDRIEALQNSANDSIYQIAYRLVDQYFNDDEEDGAPEPALATNVNDQGTFEFNNVDNAGEQKNPEQGSGQFQF